jgi:hypothetical protein
MKSILPKDRGSRYGNQGLRKDLRKNSVTKLNALGALSSLVQQHAAMKSILPKDRDLSYDKHLQKLNALGALSCLVQQRARLAGLVLLTMIQSGALLLATF